MDTDSGRSPSGRAAAADAVEPEEVSSKASIPNAGDWQYAQGDIPQMERGTVIWALGRYGDVFGPLPFEMFAADAWGGYMLHASHDLVAWAPCNIKWRDLFPYQMRDPSVFGKRATAASAIEARRVETAGLDAKHESAVGEAETPKGRGPTEGGA